jgi:tetratricopeptide (TPR) repeat protein
LREAQELEPALNLDPEAEASALTVANLIAKGKNRAQAGDMAGATESLQKARELTPTMNLDPQVAAARWGASALIERGGRLVAQGKANEVLASYEAAQEVNPRLRVSSQSWNLLRCYGSPILPSSSYLEFRHTMAHTYARCRKSRITAKPDTIPGSCRTREDS